MNYYYFALASTNFFMNEEPLEEILRERTNYYKNINKDIDFWFIKNAEFIKDNITLQEATNISYAAIVSSDKDFILWLKLRLGFVIIGEFKSQWNKKQIYATTV